MKLNTNQMLGYVKSAPGSSFKPIGVFVASDKLARLGFLAFPPQVEVIKDAGMVSEREFAFLRDRSTIHHGVLYRGVRIHMDIEICQTMSSAIRSLAGRSSFEHDRMMMINPATSLELEPEFPTIDEYNKFLMKAANWKQLVSS